VSSLSVVVGETMNSVEELREWIESDFEIVVEGFGSRYPLPPWPGALTPFVRIGNGEVWPEGEPAAYTADDFYTRLGRFEEGWRRYRTEHPGRVLYWRIPPCNEEWTGANISMGHWGFLIRARFLILDADPGEVALQAIAEARTFRLPQGQAREHA
jgi:hypothetical protein